MRIAGVHSEHGRGYGWLVRDRGELPPGDAWLAPRERAHLARLVGAKRREEWLLGRLAAKSAAAAWLGVPRDAVEVLPGPDGAPRAWIGAAAAPIAVSLAHRRGRALAVVGPGDEALGCDLEPVEPRGPAFLAGFTETERSLLGASSGRARDELATALWSAKEAAAKARGDLAPLRLRRATVSPQADCGAWSELTVRWPGDPAEQSGWWRAEDGWVSAVVGTSPAGSPAALEAREGAAAAVSS